MTKLGTAIEGKAAAPAVVSRFMAALSGTRVRRPITIPGLGITGVMVLMGTERALDVEAEVTKSMRARGLDEGLLHQTVWELERARRVLPEVILDDAPDRLDQPLGTVAEWGAVAKEIVIELWRAYIALSEEHDPAEVPLSIEERALVLDSIVKKNVQMLRSLGVRVLSLSLLTLGDLLAISPPPKSSSGPSSPES